MSNVAVIGGGASGMLAALTAAEDGSNRVTLFEKQDRVGKKLLVTGNGRCNLTNTGAELRNYHGNDSGFAGRALGMFPPESAMEYFRKLGLVCTEQYGGRVYPLSDSAGSVLDVLRYALSSAGVEVKTDTGISLASYKNGKFHLFSDKTAFQYDNLIIACGGKAGGKNGSSDGYDLLRSFGHRCTKLYPSLVPIRTDTDYPRSLKGVRADAHLRLYSGKELLCESRGELQFTEKGISGPAAFDISRSASVYGGDVAIDFLRDIPLREVEKLLLARRESSPELECSAIFTGILHSRLGLVMVKYAGLRPSGLIRDVSDGSIRTLAEAAKRFTLHVTGTDSFDSAQVTAGGIETSGFSPDTLESRIVPGLFACGEVLDIDGDCGGYNLQWAWASGRLAGRLGK